MDSDTGVRICDNGLVHHKLETPISYYLTSFIILLLVPVLYFMNLKSQKPIDLPFHGLDDNDSEAPKKRWMTDSINLLREGYAKFGDRPFQVWTTEGNQVVLPPKLIDELKFTKDDKVTTTLLDIIQAKHTTFAALEKDDFMARLIKHELNKNIPQIFPYMKEEVDHALPIELPYHDWTPVKVYGKVTRVVSIIAGRAFVGEKLNRNEKWIGLSINYAQNISGGASKLRVYPPYIRSIAKYFVPEIRQVWKHNADAEKLLTPIIKQRLRDEKLEGYEKPNDYLQWTIDGLEGLDRKDYGFQARSHLSLGAASIHNTSQLLTSAIFDLAAYPEYKQILRDEVREVLKEFDGQWSLEMLSQLKKMDSFVKESQRRGANVISFPRKAVQDLTLSDGTFIHAGTFVIAPSLAISADESIYPDADNFDGLRYYRLRQRSREDENMHQLTSTSKTMTHFGLGRHACPGRWFASAEIKTVLASLLLEYDFKLKEGEGRPKNMLVQVLQLPDPRAEILFKRMEV